MADTEEMLQEQGSPEFEQSGEPDYPTIEPAEDDNPHFAARHDPPEDFDK